MTRVVLVENHGMVAEAVGLALERAEIEVSARCATVAIPELAATGSSALVLTGEATASIAARVAEAGEVVFDAKLLTGVLNRLTGRVRFAGSELEAVSIARREGLVD